MAPQPQRHPTLSTIPQTPTSYPIPPATSPYFTTTPPPTPSPPIHRDPPNIKNTLLMSDPLYRPSNASQTAHLFRNGILHPYPALEDEYEDDEDDEENWIDDPTPEKDGEGRQQEMALPAHGRGSGRERDREEGRGSPKKARRRSARIGARMREDRRSGSPPAHHGVERDIRQRDDHHRYPGQELRGRSEVYEEERSATTESRPSRGSLKNGRGGRARAGWESDGFDDLVGKSTGYWDRQEARVRGVRRRGMKRQGTPENGRFGY